MAKQTMYPLGELLDASCRFTILSKDDEGVAEIWTNGLILKPKLGRTRYIPFIETAAIKAANYRIAVTTTASSVLTLSHVGIKFDPFSQKLVETWGDTLARALLM